MQNPTWGAIRCAGAGLTLGTVLLTGTGCAIDNPPETTQITAATNGITAQIGPMKLEDMLILSYGADQPGRVLGAVFNSSSQEAAVTISGASGSHATIHVTAGGQTLLTSSPAVELNPAGGPPGSMVMVRLREDATGATADVQFPVLDPSRPEYQPYMPSAPATGTSVRPGTG
jgi:hypothetical protein